MTAINDLVRKAYARGSRGSTPFPLTDAVETIGALYASAFEILETLFALELLRIEFRMPAAPPAQEPPAGEKAPEPVQKLERDVTVGPINVYTVAKGIQDALDRMGAEALDVGAAYARYMPQEKIPVTPSPPKIVESPDAMPPEIPQAHRRPVGPVKVEVPPVKAHRLIREAPTIEKASRPAHIPARHEEAPKEAPAYRKATEKNIPVKAPMHEDMAVREVRRSVTVINELREFYDILMTNTPSLPSLESGGLPLPGAVLSGTLKAPYQAPDIPVSPATAPQPQPSITIPIPMARPAAPKVMPISPASSRAAPAAQPDPPVHTPEATSEKASAGSPQVRYSLGNGDAREHIKLRVIHKNIDVPLIKPILSAPPTAEESAANAMMISEAIAMNSMPVASTGPSLPAQVPILNLIPGHQAPPASGAPGQSGSIASAMPVQAARALSAIYNTAKHTVTFMDGYARLAVDVSRAAGRAVESTGGTFAEAPLTKLIYAASAPIASPLPSLNLPMSTGPRQAFNLAAEGPAEAVAPAMNLVMGIAASRAVQNAGSPAINNFIRVLPSLGGGLQGPIPVERIGAGPINIHVPQAPIERPQEAGSVNKVSNFHNTFNIAVSVKGGSDDGDLRELGKKIGRILSDEIKRYGGV